MAYIDTHCHLTDDKLYDNIEEIVRNSKKYGVKYIISISDNANIFEKNRKISEQFDNIFWTLGIHPHYAEQYSVNLKEEIISNIPNSEKNEYYLKNDTNNTNNDESNSNNNNTNSKNDDMYVNNAFDYIISNFNHKKVVAIGEIGLDYYYGNDKRNEQISLFEKQLKIASKTNLPIIIHSRNSDDDLFNLLKRNKITNTIVMHCYTSDIEFAKKLIDNFEVYFSFNGIITFKKSKNVREVLEYLPLDNIILETDAPYLTPVPYRGKTNKPEFMNLIYEECSKIKKISLDIFQERIYNNSLKVFNLE